MRKPLPRAPRYGNYRVTRIAGTPMETPSRPTAPRSGAPATKPEAWRILWADRPLDLPQGRALGLRQRGDVIEVAVVSGLTLSLRWEPSEKVLSARQAKAWQGSSGFRPA